MRLILPLAAIAVLALAPAFGQAAPPAGKRGSALGNHNSNAPVDIVADRIEVQDRDQRAIFSGNVVARQSDMTMTAARVTVTYARQPGTSGAASTSGNTGSGAAAGSTAGAGGNVQIKRLDASGGVTVRNPTETAHGSFGIYDLDRKIITLLGGVTLVRGDSHVAGNRLVIDIDSGRAVVDGGGAPGSATQGGRVTGTFTVTQKKK